MASNVVRLPFVGRVIYPFHSHLDGELSLEANDLVLITRLEDRYWFYGQIGNDKGRFPQKNIIAVTDLPAASVDQPYFAALADFSQQQPGDLSFKQGEILVGLHRVDTNWWHGRNALGREGIFPTSLAWQLDLRPVQNESTNCAQSTRKRARVLQHLVAQLPEELDLKKGEELIVTGETEDGWLRGECNGRSGIFPSGFVTFLADEETLGILQPIEISNNSAAPKSQILSCPPIPPRKVDDQKNGRPYGIASYDFQGQQADELSLYAGQTVFLIRHVNAEWMEGETSDGRKGIFPTSFLEILIDCHEAKNNQFPNKMDDVDLLLDFDPLVVNENHSTLHLSTNQTNNRHTGQLTKDSTSSREVSDATHTSLDSFIARNLNLLDLSSPKQASDKQRPASWSQTLTKLQIEYSKQARHSELPAIPPRRQETQSAGQVAQVIHHHPAVPASEVESSSSVIGNKPAAISYEPCGSISSSSGLSDSGASRKTYTRPAPPPPADSPNLGLSRQDSTDSVGSHCQPFRPAPLIPTEGGDDRVEGRRQRTEKAKQRKMEEDRLRDLEMRKKVKEQREKVIKELLGTEREYCRDLRLTCQVFKLDQPEYLERKGVDVATLFGNISEVITLSETFIDQLNKCTRSDEETKPDHSIGKTFKQTEPEFRRVYGLYCINHDNAQFLLEKYETLPSVNKLLDEGVASLRDQIVCFNMGSIIIKPVQRIMKYPLILGELIKFTENDHPDKSNLVQAFGMMTAVATHINESKRKKEIVLKYRDSGQDEKLSQKISRFTMHSVAKKSSRIGMLLKTSLGMAPTTRDTAFDEIEARFGELFRVIQTALDDITTVCEQLKVTAQTQYNISEAVASFYGEGSKFPLIDNFRTAQRIIYNQHWNAFDAYVIQHVRNPLTALCHTCVGPERLVVKRRDKLLDANIASERVAKNRDAAMRRTLEEEENLARNTYTALNGQLMEELPVITEHGYNIYRRCISSFLYARKLLVGRITKALLDLNEIPDIANLQGDIDEDFNVAFNKAVDRFARITFINKSFRRSTSSTSTADGSLSPNDVTPSRRTSGLGNHSPGEGMIVQSRESVNMLRSKYLPDQLYMVTGRCEIKDPLDLAANSGMIVSVIKREDPMGNSARWFVDAGEVRGFLPARHLSPNVFYGSNQLLRPESAASMASSAASGGSGTSNSLESFKELHLLDPERSSINEENFYDLPPSYEEALGTEEVQSPHRYCEIDDLLVEGSDPKDAGAKHFSPQSPEQAESPIYAEIDDVISEKKEELPSKNNVYKVEYPFEKRTNLEIDLVDGELVTVLAKNDEAGNLEWWLVENDEGAQGYAPAAYLSELVTERETSQLFG